MTIKKRTLLIYTYIFLAGLSGEFIGYGLANLENIPRLENLKDDNDDLSKEIKKLIAKNQKLSSDNKVLRDTNVKLKKQLDKKEEVTSIPSNELFVINVGDDEKDIKIIAKRYATLDGEETKMYYYQNVLNENDCYLSWNHETSIIAGTLYVDERKTKTLLQEVPVYAMQDSYTKEELQALQDNINTNNFTYQKTK